MCAHCSVLVLLPLLLLLACWPRPSAQLLYRVQIKKSLQLLIAPLGGSIDAIGRAVTPIQGGIFVLPVLHNA